LVFKISKFIFLCTIFTDVETEENYTAEKITPDENIKKRRTFYIRSYVVILIHTFITESYSCRPEEVATEVHGNTAVNRRPRCTVIDLSVGIGIG